MPADYKFFCFNGEPRFAQVDTDRFTHHRDMFDLEWKRLPFNIEYASSGRDIPRPGNLETMISAERALSRGFPFVRVDLYSIGERVIFSEMTWYPGGGFERFSPDIHDLHVGEAPTLPRPSGLSLVTHLPFWISPIVPRSNLMSLRAADTLVEQGLLKPVANHC